ncbi:carbohydrate ABC transporter permease [Histidinibacterium lentulum]|uniref:Sugar ABC transporter permease n=1 Tax=Histidinibacterium lentulum TaxID=2480588 RepID=A0A3N2QTG5_9RHOB|nr:sugar ABC transporter permease [Histidinibacterium lentulum]ROT98516.1 sugar ABC transporter permease [Histidinibacterium lentulum]
MAITPQATARFVLVPTILLTVVGYYGSILWTIGLSFTPSRILPVSRWAGLDMYERLLSTERWQVAYTNLFVFGGLYIGFCLAAGLLLAIALDQGVKGRSVYQTIFLYPIALSFIVTGLAWRWLLNPTTGLQDYVRSLGFESFSLDLLSSPERAIFTLVIAGVWHSAGLVMVILFAGLQSVDQEIWRAGRVDGIPRHRMYRHVVLPMLWPMVVTCLVLLGMNVVRSYDLVVALTGGGPGFSTDVPAKFIVDHYFERQSVGLASAAATLLLLTVVVLFALVGLLRRRGEAA